MLLPDGVSGAVKLAPEGTRVPLRKINLLHLVLSFRRGGRRNAITNLALGTKDAVNPHLCCLEEFGCPSQELDGLFCTASTLAKTHRNRFAASRQLASICQEREIELIHAHDAASQYLAALARFSRPRMKVLMTFHRTLGFESARYRDKLRNAFCGMMCEAVVTPSKERKRHYLSENPIAASKLVVVPHGVDLNRFAPNAAFRQEVRSALGIGDETVLIGTVGHFGPEKGVDLGIEAFNQCTQRHPDLDLALLVLGDGNSEQQDRIRQLSQVDRSRPICLAGFQPDVWRWLAALDIMLHTPRMEAFGLVVAEAMACMLPVVATAVGSMPEVVRNEETGLVVEPESVPAIARALARLASDREFRSRLAARAHRIAHSEYSSALCAQRHAELYQRICRAAAEPVEDSLPPKGNGCNNGVRARS